MNPPFAVALVLLAVFVAVGWPVARLAGRSPAWSVATTPAAAGVAAATAVAVATLTRTSMLPWLGLMAVLGWAEVLRRRRRGVPVLDEDGPGLWALLAALAVALVPVVLVDLPAVENDSRWSWWFHAAWFRGGGDVTRTGMAHPSLRHSHPGYPPLAPALIAAVWHVRDAYDREVALRVGQLVTATAVAATAFFTTATIRPGRRGHAAALAALVAAACWGANDVGIGLTGFVDVTWAVLFAPAAVLVLTGPMNRRNLAVAALFAAAAALVKVEVQAAVVLLVVLGVARAGRAWRSMIPVAAATGAAIIGWKVVTVVGGAASQESADWSRLPDLVVPGSVVQDRFLESLPALLGDLGPLVWAGALGIVAAVAAARLTGVRLRQPGLLLLLALVAGYILAVILAFSVAGLPLDDYFVGGAYRYVCVARVLVVVDVILALVAVLRVPIGIVPPAPATEPDPEGAKPEAVEVA